MGQARTYTEEFKAQAIKLAKEVGTKRASEEIGVPKNTLGTWVHKAKKREVDPGKGERMHAALKLKYQNENIPSERTVYRVMEQIGANLPKRRSPNGITKADREARKSDDLLKRDFAAQKPCEKCVTDITEIPAKNGKLYVSAIFDCFDVSVLDFRWTIICAPGCASELLKMHAEAIPKCARQSFILTVEANIQAKNTAQ